MSEKQNTNDKTKDYLPQAWLYPSTDLAQFHGTLFGFYPMALSVFTFFFGFRTLLARASLKRLG
jgi:hypothetical protein